MSAFPSRLPLSLDRNVRIGTGDRWLLGGDPPRALALSPAGGKVLRRLLASGADGSAPARGLARTLVDGGFAHPQPAPATAIDVTVVVPVRDRTAALGRCLDAVAHDRVPMIVVDDGSADPDGVAAVCAQRRARLVARERAGGPAAARNTALQHVKTELVAFLDSDCVPSAGWLAALAGHFADPLVAAAAPRVRGLPGGAGPVSRFAAVRLTLDRGPSPARVIPGGRVAYVPTAAIVIRRAALRGGFDERLRYGEDVDLIWRLHDAGWRIRYDPAAVVEHAEPLHLRPLLARRFRYGTSAAALADRHPGRLAPLVVHPWSAAAATLALQGRPRLAAIALGAQSAVLAHRMRPAGVPSKLALAYSVRGSGQMLVALGRAATMLAPAALAVGLARRETRRAALALLVAPPLADWATMRPPLDPIRWTMLSVADDVAYGAGVWAGAVRARTIVPLLPKLRISARRAPSAMQRGTARVDRRSALRSRRWQRS